MNSAGCRSIGDSATDHWASIKLRRDGLAGARVVKERQEIRDPIARKDDAAGSTLVERSRNSRFRAKRATASSTADLV